MQRGLAADAVDLDYDSISALLSAGAALLVLFAALLSLLWFRQRA